jgi:hypothetical protein
MSTQGWAFTFAHSGFDRPTGDEVWLLAFTAVLQERLGLSISASLLPGNTVRASRDKPTPLLSANSRPYQKEGIEASTLRAE